MNPKALLAHDAAGWRFLFKGPEGITGRLGTDFSLARTFDKMIW